MNKHCMQCRLRSKYLTPVASIHSCRKMGRIACRRASYPQALGFSPVIRLRNGSPCLINRVIVSVTFVTLYTSDLETGALFLHLGVDYVGEEFCVEAPALTATFTHFLAMSGSAGERLSINVGSNRPTGSSISLLSARSCSLSIFWVSRADDC